MYDDLSSEERIIHVCVNIDCALRGAEAVRDRLRQLADDTGSDVEVNDYICFAACEQGPNLLIEHRRAFYSEVEPTDAEAVLAHAEGGDPVQSIDRSGSFIARKIFNMLDAGFKPGDLSLSD
ncbi:MULTISPECIES: (2Fe-2S) ferredoxin domain-containing protein [Mycolicibacterium]|uniref:(2Fe-2S) ferredoxin domain-containing protein n=1 Tax=Mycolicibacterium austroafricanum TaxID=39687 RepID=A0ABT8HQE4_MYCAO|nr:MULTISPECIES: (2Fe-2S) ferredoxin domain-containing protein [Mycolicibacterium]MDN4522725.1 (2Fe-2S) ferredoxin domain-containing protein [Mycolicibacterium austroafricanum]MDW5609361.1 (2Fe-2S) ferredoxin domain-containing protein [Mycolicibacterium sp. D5.8-2]QRZ06927.1 (2Fe-2S) ferredoxin domain-containing protein [Mycolicibacterium austroafricanum]QZT57010.1 (2Fe-2S) ferredoxin domain-containing protein [Mycolicibacterium austroafricanum]QZT62829.1 (2Fe-2S) ferredoxin domain-containing 